MVDSRGAEIFPDRLQRIGEIFGDAGGRAGCVLLSWSGPFATGHKFSRL